MKQSTTLRAIVAVVIGLLLIGFATVVQAGYKIDAGEWLQAQRQSPVLWLLDGYVVAFAALLVFLGGSGGRLRIPSENAAWLREEHKKQLEAMITHTQELERQNTEYADRIAGLEAELDARHESFETEARRLTEQAFRALQGQVDSHTRQLDAVNLALQYQRAELKQVRHVLQPAPESAQIAGPKPWEPGEDQEAASNSSAPMSDRPAGAAESNSGGSVLPDATIDATSSPVMDSMIKNR